jgi:hypothetical protein
MKKFIVLTTLLIGFASDGFCKAYKFSLYIGAVSRDGSGILGFYWGGGCIDGDGFCVAEKAINYEDPNAELLEINENLELIMEVSKQDNLVNLSKYTVDNQYNLLTDSPVNQLLTSKYDFLDKEGKYYVKKGLYNIEDSDGKKIIKLKLERI